MPTGSEEDLDYIDPAVPGQDVGDDRTDGHGVADIAGRGLGTAATRTDLSDGCVGWPLQVWDWV